jgi:hypothetical protein
MLASTLSAFAPSAHNIQRAGIGFAAGLTTDQLMRAVPSAFADGAHESRSARYAYVPTIGVIEGLRAEGFLPVKALQSRSRDMGKAGHAKHMIRFRREDQLGAEEAREVILVNSHDGSSAYQMNAGIFRLVCSNGLCVGNEDIKQSVRHSGDVKSEIIDCAYRIIGQFDQVTDEIESMKSARLAQPLMLAFAAAAIEARFDGDEKPVTAEQVLRPRRHADIGDDAWSVLNRIQENVIKGGLHGATRDANGRMQRRRTREVAGIDQNNMLNRALWKLATEVAKIAA